MVLTISIASSPSQAATKIQHLVSPGGIEAWFVQDATVPLIAMEYAFGGGATQDPTDKPGVGNLVVSAVLRRDYPVIQGALLVISGVYVLINLGIDLLYAVLDPRVRY